MLRKSEKAQGFPLTEREAGGKDRGGSILTVQAVRLLKAYDSFMKEAREKLGRLFEKHFSQDRVEKLKNG